MRTLSTALAACVVAVAVVACGDGRLDSGELHDKVKAACSKASKALELAPNPTNDQTAKLFVSRAWRANDTLYRELAGLKPPEDAQQGYSYAVNLVRKQARAFSQARGQLDGGGDAVLVLRSLTKRSLELSTQERTSWQIVGVGECAER